MTTVAIRDEVTTRSGRPPLRFTLDFPTTQITVRELIRSRVTGEVNDYNMNQTEYFQGLVQPTGAEATLNGYRVGRGRVIDPKRQVEQALAAFQANGFMILVDDRQVDELDEVITLQETTQIIFLKLIPLVGG